MRNKVRLNNPSELRIGTRVKIPFGGWFFGTNGTVWVKGKIIKTGDVREDGKIHSVTTYCYSKKYGTIGRIMSLNEQCNEVYKTI